MSRARTLAISVAGLGVVYFAGTQIKDFRTPGVRNIERRHTAAGGGHNHTPAIASKLGDENSVEGRQETQKGMHGTSGVESLVGMDNVSCDLHVVS